MKRKSIYKYAAEAGIPVGLYLTAMSATFLLSINIEFLPIFLLPLSLGFPVLLWFIIRRIGREEPSYMKFSSLWLGGIYSVIFGTLICMLFSGFYVTFFEPGFVHAYVSNVVSLIEQSTMAVEYEATTTLMKEAMAAHILPSGMEFITTMGWFTCFAGSMLSLIIALIVSYSGKKFPERIEITNS